MESREFPKKKERKKTEKSTIRTGGGRAWSRRFECLKAHKKTHADSYKSHPLSGTHTQKRMG